jgi:hypothetical protein
MGSMVARGGGGSDGGGGTMMAARMAEGSRFTGESRAGEGGGMAHRCARARTGTYPRASGRAERGMRIGRHRRAGWTGAGLRGGVGARAPSMEGGAKVGR